LEKDELVTKWHRFQPLRHSSVLPKAFTEHGVVMLASVLNSDVAIKISIHIVQVFIQIKRALAVHKEINKRIEQLETRIGENRRDIKDIVILIRKLLEYPEKEKDKIGFHP